METALQMRLQFASAAGQVVVGALEQIRNVLCALPSTQCNVAGSEHVGAQGGAGDGVPSSSQVRSNIPPTLRVAQ